MTNGIQAWVDNNGEKIRSLLPAHVEKDRFLRNMVFQVSNNPAVSGCDHRSIIEACLTATTYGLDIGVLGQAYLVPYKGRAQLIIGYQGLLTLARRGDGIRSVHVECVREGDKYERTAMTFEHKWDPFGERGEIVGFYCIFVLKDGSEQIETMSRAQVDAIRGRSKSGNSGPWSTDYEEMGKKTVLRRALKKVSLSVDAAQAIHHDDKAEFPAEFTVNDPSPKDVVRKALERQPPPPESEEGLGKSQREETALPPPPSPSEPKRPSKTERDWDYDLEQANRINGKIGAPTWRMMNAPRKTIIRARMREQGIEDPKEFWARAREVFSGWDDGYWEGWTSGRNLETLLRVPQRGGPDHFTYLLEGPLPGGKAKEPSPVNQPADQSMDEDLAKMWKEAGE